MKITHLHSVVSTVSVFYKQQLLARTLNTCMQPPWQGEANSNKLALIFVSFFPRHVIQSFFFLSKILLYFVLKLRVFTETHRQQRASIISLQREIHSCFFQKTAWCLPARLPTGFEPNTSVLRREECEIPLQNKLTHVHAHTHIVDESVRVCGRR